MVLLTNLSTPKGRRKKTSNCGHVRQRGPRLKFFYKKMQNVLKPLKNQFGSYFDFSPSK